MVAEIFGSDDVLQKLRKVQAIVRLLEGYPKKRARAAAARGLFFGSTDYRGLKNILRQGLDLQPLPEKQERNWSNGSRFARKPTEPLFAHQEEIHVDHQ